MVIVGVRIPSSLLAKLQKRAKKMTEETGVEIGPSTVARTILQEHA